MKKIIIFSMCVIFILAGTGFAETYIVKTKDNEVSSINDVIIEKKAMIENIEEMSLKKINKEIAGLVAHKNRLEIQIIELNILKTILTKEAEKIVLIDPNSIGKIQ